MTLPCVLIAVCLGATAVHVFAEWRRLSRTRAISKIAASSAFVLLAFALDASASTYGLLILVALALSWIGDVLLLSSRAVLFQVGIAAFLLAHLAFAAALATRGLDGQTLLIGGALMAAFGFGVLRWLWPHLTADFRIPVVAYIAAIMLMCALAIAASVANGAWLLGAAALMFALSDISVARDRFVKEDFINRLWGLPLYFIAQILFALSVDAAPGWLRF